MALFDRLKNLFFDAGKDNADTADQTDPAAAADGAEMPADGDAEGQIEKPEPEPGSEEYLLQELENNSESFPNDVDSVRSRVYSIQEAVRSRLDWIRKYTEWLEQKEEDDESKPPVKAMDAEARAFCSTDRMAGFLYCLAPVGDGAEITKEMLSAALADGAIQYGIDEALLDRIVEEKSYYRIFAAARGTAPVKGEDGQVIDRFSREPIFRLQEDEKGNIDHKNTGVFQTAKKGQVICEFIPPKEGTDGCDVMGNAVPAKKGDMPHIPKGKNTVLNEDGSALLASADGDVSFQNDMFRVEPQLTVNGNVDNTTGNINFAGDVIINGDVLRGFSVTAGGSITVRGMVEGAVLTAGEDIVLEKGMNGINGGSLNARGSVRSRFLEQATIVSGKDVAASAMINCDVRAGGSILATSGKGILIGGKLRAEKSVEARRIGNQSDANTIIKIGYAMDKKENVNEITKELGEAKATYDKISQNLRYLNGLPEIPEKNKALYETLVSQEKIYEEMINNLMEKIEMLENKAIDYTKCYVHGDTIYGITEVCLNHSHVFIRDETPRCNIYFSKEKGELVVGTF